MKNIFERLKEDFFTNMGEVARKNAKGISIFHNLRNIGTTNGGMST